MPYKPTTYEGLDRLQHIEKYVQNADKGAVQVMVMGAVGDGVADDTAAIQNALNSVPGNGGRVVLPAGGSFRITSTLSIKTPGTIIEGGGWGAQIVFDGSVVSPAINAASSLKAFIRDIRISQSNATSNGTAIDASNFNGGAIERVLIDAALNGAPPVIGVDYNAAGCHYNVLSDSRINVAGSNAIGVRYSTTANSNVVRNCRILPSASDATNTGVLVDATTILLEHVDIESAAGIAVDVTANGHGTTLINPYFEANGTNLRLASGVVAPTVIGGTNESASTANLTDNGASGAVILGVRNSAVPYTHGGRNFLRIPDNLIQPADHGLASWTFDPAVISNGSLLTGGTAYFTVLPIRNTVAVTKIWFIVTAAAVGATSGQCFFGLYSVGATQGTLLASADCSGVVGATGPQSVTISSQVLTPGYYLACIMCNAATTLPTIARNAGAPGYGNVNLSTSNLRFFSNTTGNTTSLPSPITLSSNTTANAGTQDYWAGVS